MRKDEVMKRKQLIYSPLNKEATETLGNTKNHTSVF